VVFENEQDNGRDTQRKRSLVTSEPQHVTLIVFGIGMVNRTHLEADIGGLTMESELKRIHGSFTLKEKMKGGISENVLCNEIQGQLYVFVCVCLPIPM